MNSQTHLGLLDASLRRVLSENGMDGHFIRRFLDGEDCFESITGIHLHIFFRAAISADFVDRKTRERSDVLSNGGHLLFVSPRFSQQLIDAMDKQGIHFYSPYGYSRIRLPGFTYIVHAPAARKVVRAGNSGSAFVGKASILPRLFFREPERIWQQSELATEAGLTRAYVSIVIRRMLESGYVMHEGRGYRLLSPDQMLDDWSLVYRFDRYLWRQEYAMSFQQVSVGMDKLFGAIAGRTSQFALMGQCGAYLRCPYLEPSLVTAYVSEPLDDVSGLHPVERDGNVILYIPPNHGVFIGENKIGGLPVVSDIQLYLDLMKMPGRSTDQADYLRENLLNWSE